jgi:hypothetical protein
MSEHAYINLLLSSVTVPGPDGRLISVHPWHDRERFANDPTVVVVVRGEHFAQYVSDRGPLFRPSHAYAKLFPTVPAINIRDARGVTTQRAESTSFRASGPNDPPLALASGPRDAAPHARSAASHGPAAGAATVSGVGVAIATGTPVVEPTDEELAAADAALATSAGDSDGSEGSDGSTADAEAEAPTETKAQPAAKLSLRESLKGKKK